MNMAIFLAVCTLFSWAFADLLYTYVLKTEKLRAVTFVAQFCGGLFLIPFANSGEWASLNIAEYWYCIAFLGVLNLLGIMTLMKAFQSKGVALAAPILHAWVLPLSILALIFWGEFPTALQWSSIAVIIGGLFFISVEKRDQLHVDPLFIFAFVSMMIWAITFFFIQEPSAAFGGVLIPAGMKIVSALLVLPSILKKPIQWPKGWKMWATIVVIGAFDGFGLLAFVTASELSPSIAVVAGITAASPAVSALLGVAILKEKITKWQAFGILAVVLGLILIAT